MSGHSAFNDCNRLDTNLQVAGAGSPEVGETTYPRPGKNLVYGDPVPATSSRPLKSARAASSDQDEAAPPVGTTGTPGTARRGNPRGEGAS